MLTRSTMRTLGLAALVLLAASPEATAKTKAGSCAKRVKTLELRMAEIPTHVGFGESPLKLQLPEVEAGQPVTARGAIFDLRGDDLAFEGQAAREGVEALDREIRRIEGLEKLIQAKNAPVYMRIDRRTPVGKAVDAMCRIAEHRTVHLVVDNPKAAAPVYTPPPPTKIVMDMMADLAQLPDPSKRAARMTGEFEKAITPCDALSSGVAAVSLAPPSHKARYLKRAVIDGVRACQCKDLDVDTIESLVILMTAPVSAAVHAFAPKLPCGQPEPYGLKATDQFGELAKRMAVF